MDGDVLEVTDVNTNTGTISGEGILTEIEYEMICGNGETIAGCAHIANKGEGS